MTISPGTRLGSYEITNAIGAGGMGEVFRARDTRLNRDVAIKVLPAAFADDPERLARFTREAQTLASLNHPNIAAIYGVEDVGARPASPDAGARGDASGEPGPGRPGPNRGAIALIMELVEGEDLSTLIARGPIPITEALSIARQIAEALEAAHEQGIVHRDLKPANVKVRNDGTVKVLDFGLAKAMDPAGAASSNPNVSHSPTLTHQGTSAGMIIGTAAYMSPEQAKGKSVDKRADIWAFGVVLWEMLTGARLFKGEDVSDTLAAVLRQDVALAALPADTPLSVRRLVARCLDRDLKRRLRDIGEARLILEDPARVDLAFAATPSSAPTAASTPTWRVALPWAIAALAGVGLVFTVSRRPDGRAASEGRRLLAAIGADAYVVPGSDDVQGSAIAVSPDGNTLVFLGARKTDGSKPQLFVRRLDQLQASPLDGTEGALAPFFSPDSRWIAFFVGTGSDGVLKKIPVEGGAPQKLSPAPLARGGAWAEDDTIVFGQLTKPASTLMRVSAAGGTPVAFGAFGEGATSQRWPQILPGGAHVLYTEHSSVNRFDHANLAVASLPTSIAPASTNARGPKIVHRGGFYGRYVAVGSNGYLTYLRGRTLMARPFDVSRLEVTGPEVPVVEDVSLGGPAGSASVAVSVDGTLVYVPETGGQFTVPAQWLSRDGKVSPGWTADKRWFETRFSPDGQQVAFVQADQQRRLFVLNLARDIPTPVAAPGQASAPVWSPDGKRLAYGSDSGVGVSNLWLTNADGSGTPTRLTTSPNDQQPGSWDPSGKFLAYTEIRPNTTRDVMILPVEGDASRGWTAGTPVVYKGTAATERDPVFSPDGRWIAYVSDDVHVSPFPGPGPAVPVSIGGGWGPRWSATSKELLFWASGKVMSVPYAAAAAFVPGKPRPWAPQSGAVFPGFDIHPDGRRVLAQPWDTEAIKAMMYSRDKIVLWSGFADYLRKNVGVKK